MTALVLMTVLLGADWNVIDKRLDNIERDVAAMRNDIADIKEALAINTQKGLMPKGSLPVTKTELPVVASAETKAYCKHLFERLGLLPKSEPAQVPVVQEEDRGLTIISQTPRYTTYRDCRTGQCYTYQVPNRLVTGRAPVTMTAMEAGPVLAAYAYTAPVAQVAWTGRPVNAYGSVPYWGAVRADGTSRPRGPLHSVGRFVFGRRP